PPARTTPQPLADESRPTGTGTLLCQAQVLIYEEPDSAVPRSGQGGRWASRSGKLIWRTQNSLAQGSRRTQKSDAGIPVEEISHLAGHRGTSVTELVYRHQLRPVIQTGARVMDQLFKRGSSDV